MQLRNPGYGVQVQGFSTSGKTQYGGWERWNRISSLLPPKYPLFLRYKRHADITYDTYI